MKANPYLHAWLACACLAISGAAGASVPDVVLLDLSLPGPAASEGASGSPSVPARRARPKPQDE